MKAIKMVENVFEQRRKKDPQGVIDDLLKQTSLQAGKIYKLNNKLKNLTKELEKYEKSSLPALEKK